MKKMKHLGLVLTCIALVCALGLSLAFFTDRVQANGSIATKENALDIDVTKPDNPVEPDPSNPTDPDFPKDPTDPSKPWEDPTPGDDSDDLQNWWRALNATALGNFNPGDKLCLDAKIINNGTLDLDYRQTFVITSSVPLKAGNDGTLNTADDTTDPVFRLFESCVRESYGALTGVTPVVVETLSTDGMSVTYAIAPAFLAAGDSLNVNYDMVFDKLAANKYMGATITVDYLIEARQANAEGADADWTTVATDSITFGGQTVNAVPKAKN